MRRIKEFIGKLIVLSILLIQSSWVFIKSLFKPNKILIEKEYRGQKILLIALYQKNILRNDLKKMLEKAKNLGFYIIGVNTQKLIQDTPDLFDCYIQRFNYGRDFGSYKTGFNYIFNKKIHLKCPRLLMCNDSVYYEPSRVERFLYDLMNSNIEVLGATENYEINHHLGSFCIVISGRVLSDDKFIRYWEKYRNSEIRPLVILRGEMGLTACLKQVVGNPLNFGALYDMAYIANRLTQDDQQIKAAFALARRSNRMPWPLLCFDKEEIVDLAKNYLGMTPKDAIYWGDQTKRFFNETTVDNIVLNPGVRQFLCAKILKTFRRGSQIHQNNAFLLHLGMPLVKLDGFYRGVFSEEDVLIITKSLPEQEAHELQTLLFSKCFGLEVFYGWKLYLFARGFI